MMKTKKKSIKNTLISMIVFIAILVFLEYNRSDVMTYRPYQAEAVNLMNMDKETESETESETETLPETELEDTIPRDEWYMILLNKEHTLPEDFTVELAVVDERGNEVDARIADDLRQMLEDGNRTGLQLFIISGYRSVEYQQTIWDRKISKYISEKMTQEEAEAKVVEFTMYPGSSDHNAGLGVDIATLTDQRLEEDFANTPEAQWLAANAWKYGFILRYPKDKEEITGVQYEPWHYRYVGKEQARIIYESGLCLEEYLAE